METKRGKTGLEYSRKRKKTTRELHGVLAGLFTPHTSPHHHNCLGTMRSVSAGSLDSVSKELHTLPFCTPSPTSPWLLGASYWTLWNSVKSPLASAFTGSETWLSLDDTAASAEPLSPGCQRVVSPRLSHCSPSLKHPAVNRVIHSSSFRHLWASSHSFPSPPLRL